MPRTTDITTVINSVSAMVSSGAVADVYTPPTTPGVLGSKTSDFTKRNGTIHVQMKHSPQEKLTKGIDAECTVLPGSSILEGYHIVVDGQRYKVQAVAPKRFCGQITHYVLELVRLHG